MYKGVKDLCLFHLLYSEIKLLMKTVFFTFFKYLYSDTFIFKSYKRRLLYESKLKTVKC